MATSDETKEEYDPPAQEPKRRRRYRFALERHPISSWARSYEAATPAAHDHSRRRITAARMAANIRAYREASSVILPNNGGGMIHGSDGETVDESKYADDASSSETSTAGTSPDWADGADR